MITDSVLKEAVDFAFNEMPGDSMSPGQAEKQKRIILAKIEEKKIRTPEEVMEAFDQLNQGAEV